MAINGDFPYKHNKTYTNTQSNTKPNPLPKSQSSQNTRGQAHSSRSPYHSHAYGASLTNTSKNQRGRRNLESSTPTPTPRPTPSSPATSQPSTTSKSRTIKATDIPQWTWTNRQTITYLTEVLISKVGKRRNEARILASKAIGDGFGLTLFLYTRETWACWFGEEVALALDGLIYSMRDKEGAVPENVHIEHYERRKRFSFEVGGMEVLNRGEDGIGIGVEERRGR